MAIEEKVRLLTLEEVEWVSGGGPGYTAPTVTNRSANTNDTNTVNQAIQILSTNYGSLTQAGQQAASQISHIDIDPSDSGRSYVDYGTQTLHLNADEVANESPSYVAGDIMHDGDHILQNASPQGYQGVQSEQQATQLELDNAQALHMNSNETQFLQNYENSTTQIQQRIDQPVNKSAAPPPPPDPSDPDGQTDNSDPTDGINDNSDDGDYNDDGGGGGGGDGDDGDDGDGGDGGSWY